MNQAGTSFRKGIEKNIPSPMHGTKKIAKFLRRNLQLLKGNIFEDEITDLLGRIRPACVPVTSPKNQGIMNQGLSSSILNRMERKVYNETAIKNDILRTDRSDCDCQK
jgi:hypothetical protein